MDWCRNEPGVDEFLSDPLIQSVMLADGVDRGELQTMLSEIAATIEGRPSGKRRGLFRHR